MSFFVISNWKGVYSQHGMNNAHAYTQNDVITNIIAPYYPCISELANAKQIEVCAPGFIDGVTTGSINLELLHSLGIRYVLCNHLEQQSQTYSALEAVTNVAQYDLIPIIFANNIVEANQLGNAVKNAIIVFEPHANIGANDAAELDSVINTIKKLRNTIKHPICYGGALNAHNYLQFIKHVDGLCFGRLSRDQIFADILKNIQNTLKDTRYTSKNTMYPAYDSDMPQQNSNQHHQSNRSISSQTADKT